MSDKIFVAKAFEMQDGEELQDVLRKVQNAVTAMRMKKRMEVGLYGIYKDHIILRSWDDNSFIQMSLSRNGDDFELGDPVAVKQTFVPVKDTVEKSEGSFHEAQQKTFWADVLGT